MVTTGAQVLAAALWGQQQRSWPTAACNRTHLASPICQNLSPQPFQLHPLVCRMLIHQSQLAATDHSKKFGVNLHNVSPTLPGFVLFVGVRECRGTAM